MPKLKHLAGTQESHIALTTAHGLFVTHTFDDHQLAIYEDIRSLDSVHSKCIICAKFMTIPNYTKSNNTQDKCSGCSEPMPTHRLHLPAV